MDSYINFSSELTQEEVVALNQLKEYIIAKGSKNYLDFHNDEFMIKFLRNCYLNTKKTYEMLIEYFRFSEEFDLPHIFQVKFPNKDKLRLFYPHGFHKVTKNHLPIFIQSLGDLKINEINRLLPDKLLTQYIACLLEECLKKIFPKCSQKFGERIHQLFCIVDLKGLTTSLMSKNIFNFIYKQVIICEKYYPGILGGLVFVNSGLVFRALWGGCKYLYSGETRNKIKVYGFNYQSKLLDAISPDNLPKFFGGECNCSPYGCIFSNEGPWNETEAAQKNNIHSFLQDHMTSEGLSQQLNLHENSNK